MCSDNQYCVLGRPRNSTAAATHTPRPTRTPAPTHTPRPTRTPEPPRATSTDGPGASPVGSRSTEPPRALAAVVPAGASTDGDAADAGDDLRASAALAGTGAPLGAAPPRSSGGSLSALGVERRPAVSVVAEYAGVRVLGPLQWVSVDEGPAVAGVINNTGAQPRTMVVTLFLLDAQGARLGSTEAVVWDLAPGESRPFTHPLPPLPAQPTDVSARLEPLVP